MKPYLYLAVALAVSIGSGQPTFAQSMNIDLSIETVSEPIPIAYRELPPTPVIAETGMAYFSGDEQVSGIHQRYTGTLSFRREGQELEGTADVVGSVDRLPVHSVCRLRANGELIGCAPSGTMAYPIFDRPGYKSGDTMNLPFVGIEGQPWLLVGRVRGKAVIGNRPALVVDFSETRTISKALADGVPVDLNLAVSGYGYLDLATGHPLVLELKIDGTGPGDGYDRIQARMQMELFIAGAPYPASERRNAVLITVLVSYIVP